MFHKLLHFTKKENKELEKKSWIQPVAVTTANFFYIRPCANGVLAAARFVNGKKYPLEVCLWDIWEKKILATLPIYSKDKDERSLKPPFTIFSDNTLACNHVTYDAKEKQNTYSIALWNIKKPDKPILISNYKNSMESEAAGSCFIKLENNFLFAKYSYSYEQMQIIRGSPCHSFSSINEARLYRVDKRECVSYLPNENFSSAVYLNKKQLIVTVSEYSVSLWSFKNNKLNKDASYNISNEDRYHDKVDFCCVASSDENYLLVYNDRSFFIFDVNRRLLIRCGYNKSVFDLVILPNNTFAMIIIENGMRKIEIWDFLSDLNKPKHIDTITPIVPGVRSLSIIEAMLIYAAPEGIYNCVSEQVLREEQIHLKQVKGIMLSQQAGMTSLLADTVLDYAQTPTFFFHGKEFPGKIDESKSVIVKPR